MKRLLGLSILFLFCATLATAQTAVVKRNVNLRSDASTSSDIIEKLRPGDQVQLVEPDQTDGFYHVTAPDGQDGWVWARNVQVSDTNPTPTPPTPTPSGDLFSQLMNAKKPAVGQPLIENGSEVCGPFGKPRNATAKALNTNKNRTDVPGDSDYVDIGWDRSGKFAIRPHQ
jgi:uncharacterized protein YgiM (DUF1202 family)